MTKVKTLDIVKVISERNMLTTGTVISVEGNFATVEIRRKAACDACHKDDCAVCSLSGGDAVMRIRAENKAHAAAGDKVQIETDSKRVLGYAFLVFLAPVLAAAVIYAVSAALGAKSAQSAVMAISGTALTFLFVGIYSATRVKKRCDAVVVSRDAK